MSAVLKQFPVWIQTKDTVEFDLSRDRDIDANLHASISSADAARYTTELGESLTDCLTNTLIEIVEDTRSHGRLNNLLNAMMREGQHLSNNLNFELIALLRTSMTEHVRARLKRRIERELL